MTFEVIGAPATKGSARAFPYRKADGGLGVRVTPDNVTLRAWEMRVRAEAVAARVRLHQPLITRPTAVRLVASFVLPRPLKFSTPKYQAGKAVAPAHSVRPDCSKLIRALEDALTGALYEDDAQVALLTVSKRYAEIGEAWGVHVEVEIYCHADEDHHEKVGTRHH